MTLKKFLSFLGRIDVRKSLSINLAFENKRSTEEFDMEIDAQCSQSLYKCGSWFLFRSQKLTGD